MAGRWKGIPGRGKAAPESGPLARSTTTLNDDLDALKFWQKRGFRLVSAYLNAMEAARKLKPQLPVAGENGIPLRDEIEMERIL